MVKAIIRLMVLSALFLTPHLQAGVVSDTRTAFTEAGTQDEFFQSLSQLEETLNGDIPDDEARDLLNLLPLIDERADDLGVYDLVEEPLNVVRYQISRRIVSLIDLDADDDETVGNFLRYCIDYLLVDFLDTQLEKFSSLPDASTAMAAFARLSDAAFTGEPLPEESATRIDQILTEMMLQLLGPYRVNRVNQLAELAGHLYSDQVIAVFFENFLEIGKRSYYYSDADVATLFTIMGDLEGRVLNPDARTGSSARMRIAAIIAGFVVSFSHLEENEWFNDITAVITGLETATLTRVAYEFIDHSVLPSGSGKSQGYVKILKAILGELRSTTLDNKVVDDLSAFIDGLPAVFFTDQVADAYYDINMEGESYGLSILRTSGRTVAATLRNSHEIYSFHNVRYSAIEDRFVFTSVADPQVEPRAWSMKFTVTGAGRIRGTFINQAETRAFEGFVTTKYPDYSGYRNPTEDQMTGTFSAFLETGTFEKAQLQLNGIEDGVGASLLFTTGSGIRVVVNFDVIAWDRNTGIVYLSSSSKKKGAVVQLRGAIDDILFSGSYIVAGNPDIMQLDMLRE